MMRTFGSLNSKSPCSDSCFSVELSEWRCNFGKGSGHPAGLNFGDWFAYALARTTGEPLLYMGLNFAQTDVESALGKT
jgi:uncharacterized protein with PIN domain